MSMSAAALPPQTQATRTGLRLPPSDPFTCLADPAAFDVYLDDEGRAHLRPLLRRLYHTAGVGGVESRHIPDPVTGEPKLWAVPAGAIARHVERGAIQVPYSWPLEVFGERFVPPPHSIGYCRPHAVQAGGLTHRLPWERPVPSGVRLRWAWDWSGYLAWLTRIQEELTGDPTAELQEAMRFQMLRRWRAAQRGSPVAQGNAARLEVKLRSLGWLSTTVAIGGGAALAAPEPAAALAAEAPPVDALGLIEDVPPDNAAGGAAPSGPASPAEAQPAPPAPEPARARKASERPKAAPKATAAQAAPAPAPVEDLSDEADLLPPARTS